MNQHLLSSGRFSERREIASVHCSQASGNKMVKPSWGHATLAERHWQVIRFMNTELVPQSQLFKYTELNSHYSKINNNSKFLINPSWQVLVCTKLSRLVSRYNTLTTTKVNYASLHSLENQQNKQMHNADEINTNHLQATTLQLKGNAKTALSYQEKPAELKESLAFAPCCTTT